MAGEGFCEEWMQAEIGECPGVGVPVHHTRERLTRTPVFDVAAKAVPNCGGRLTLEAEGIGAFADAWEEANALDMELYAFARGVARRQLLETGVHIPDEVPPKVHHASALRSL